ncbi:phage baseplate protein [Verminephrobacter aporrectodeae subsp. tuberculatae]|uniref:Phage baseplate protein n=1 Tax=Verminephrobacter aporrectodeae subsp. tuberculatae TaxID=1110392 RepID=A0ABT3KMS6_9BURK|nr:phage baseplate protein [Verminephrobacter aporrectodeae subsp. tuberculatae]
MTGMNRSVGGALSGVEHLRQSIADILSTPVGSRVMRPEYGSELPRMVDQPVTKGWVSAVQAEVVRALGRWEPRVNVRRVTVVSVIEGRVSLSIEGEYQGNATLLEVKA